MTTGIENPVEGAARSDWRLELMGSLGASDAPRVLTAADIARRAASIRPSITMVTVQSGIDGLCKAGVLVKAARGIYLNQRSVPPATLREAVTRVRSGAVVSLASALQDNGFLNNASDHVVTAVLMSGPNARPNIPSKDLEHKKAVAEALAAGREPPPAPEANGPSFVFYGLAERFFKSDILPAASGPGSLFVNGAMTPTFRPEPALLHWLHLASKDRSGLLMPPIDVDLSVLDERVLGGLAGEWGMTATLGAYLNNARARNFGEEVVAAAQVPTDERRTEAADARARMMAARRPRP